MTADKRVDNDPRATLQAKHVREILATGCVDPQPVGDCGVCLYCILYNSETVVPAVVPCVKVGQFSKWIIEYEAESEATAHVTAHGQRLATSSVILGNGDREALDLPGWQRLLSDRRESRPHCENCPQRRVCELLPEDDATT